MPLFAGDIDLKNSPLTQPFGLIKRKGQSSLEDALGRMRTSSRQGAMASGRKAPMEGDDQLSRTFELRKRGIGDSLASVLGATSLKETQAEQEHQRQLQLAREIGDMLSPSLAEEILGGLSGAAGAGGSAYALYNALGRSSGSRRSPGFGISSASNYGLEYPEIPDFNYGAQYPSMLRMR